MELGLDPSADEVYRAVLRAPDLPVAALAARLDRDPGQLRATLQALVEAGLLRADDGQPVRPDVALAPVLRAQEQALRAEQARFEEAQRALAALTEDYLVGREGSGRTSEVEVVPGLEALRGRVDQLVRGAVREVLTVSSPLEDDEESVEAVREHDAELLRRGVVVRSVYPTRLRELPRVWAYTELCAALGEQVRLTPEPPPTMVLRDREVAVLPLDPEAPERGGLVVWSRPLVAGLLALFEAVWDGAAPAFAPEVPTGHDRRLLALLAAGAKDETLARQLGRGLRTVRREVAALLADLGAETRFQAGVQAARRGWL